MDQLRAGVRKDCSSRQTPPGPGWPLLAGLLVSWARKSVRRL